MTHNRLFKQSYWEDNKFIPSSVNTFLQMLENNTYVKLTSDSSVNKNKLKISSGVGTAIADIGLEVYTQTQIINSPNLISGERFGSKISIWNGLPLNATYTLVGTCLL